MATPYPNANQIEEIFSDRDIPNKFNSYLAEDVDVTVVGKDFHLGGKHKSMQAFHDAIYIRMSEALQVETIRVEVLRVIGGGNSPWAAVESLGTATSKYDRELHLEFVDLVRFNSQGKIAQMKEFFDNGHMQSHVNEHEENLKKQAK